MQASRSHTIPARSRAQRLARIVLAVALIAAAVLPLSACNRPGSTATLGAAKLAGPRLLVIAPHPDDETVGTGGAIALARQQGWDVTVVYITNGDGFWAALRKPNGPFPSPASMQAMGESRAAESRRAAAKLGVTPDHLIYLGFPDGALHFMWDRTWDGGTVRGANGATSVPYAFALHPGAAYNGAELERELEQVIRTARPTTILLPDPADSHRDHWASAAFTQLALVRTGFLGTQLTYLVHRAGYPAQLGRNDTSPLAPSTALSAMDTRWTTLALPPAAEASQAAALAEHRSQLKSDGRLVSAFVRPNALLGADAAPSLSRGTLTLPQGAHDSAYKTGRPESTIKALGMSRSATGTVLGVDLAGKISPRVGYTLHARSIDASGNVRFYDAAYNRTRLTPIRIGAQSVMRGGRVLSASGHRIELLLPPELMVGARWLMVGADTFQGGQTADHAAWQLLRVQPL